MSAYLIGHLIGRLALSYALVWLATWLVLAKFNWRDSFRRSMRWTGLAATTTVFLLGLIAAQSNGAPQ